MKERFKILEVYIELDKEEVLLKQFDIGEIEKLKIIWTNTEHQDHLRYAKQHIHKRLTKKHYIMNTPKKYIQELFLERQNDKEWSDNTYNTI